MFGVGFGTNGGYYKVCTEESHKCNVLTGSSAFDDFHEEKTSFSLSRASSSPSSSKTPSSHPSTSDCPAFSLSPSLFLSSSLDPSSSLFPISCGSIASIYTECPPRPHATISTQTSWEIRDASGKTLHSRNPAIDKEETTELCLPKGTCMFNTCDAAGNRLELDDDLFDEFSSYNDGHYQISIDGVVIKKGTVFGYHETTTLHLPLTSTPSINPSSSDMPSFHPSSSMNPSLYPTKLPCLSMMSVVITTDAFPGDTTLMIFDNSDN